MSRHQFTDAERARGGRKAAQHPNRREICRMGYEATMERHPLAWNFLRKKIRSQNAVKARVTAMRSVITRPEFGRRRPLK